MTQEELFKVLVAHCKEYGFIFPSSEIYDGLAAVYDYGQMGVEQAARQKKNIIILYNSTRYENEWLPSYMSDYKNVARPFWITNYWGQRVGDYSYIKEALGF